jgi:CHAT domain-containing protein
MLLSRLMRRFADVSSLEATAWSASLLGLLNASEAAQLKLNAHSVVLSACNTAAGDKPGAEALPR